MKFTKSFASISSLICWALWSQETTAQTSSVPPKMVTSIENDPHFIGWYIGPAGTQPLTDPAFWTTSGSYAQGCSVSPCTWATACNLNTITYNDQSTLVCPGAHCYTMTIFEEPPYGLPSATNIFCANYWDANTVYRQLPASAAATSTSSPPATTSTPPTPDSQTSATTTGSPTTSPGASTTGPSSSTAPAGSSKAWIAGAVAGPIVGIAILAGLIWFIVRRKKKQPDEQQRIQEMEQPGSVGAKEQGMRSLKGHHELDTGDGRVYELPDHYE